MTTFKAGDKVRITGYTESEWNGRICTYKMPDTYVESETVVSHLVIDEITNTMGIGKWIPTRYLELLPDTNDEYADLSLEEQVALLTEELYQVSRSYVACSTHRDKLQQDLNHYDTVMRETKEQQGWCDDGSNEVIATLNEGFMVHFIEPYESEFEIEYEITAGVTTRGSVMVTASSEDAARDFFNDDPESYITPESEALDEARSTGWDSLEVESI